MNNKKTIQKIIIVLLISIALFAGYSYFTQNSEGPSTGGLSSIGSAFSNSPVVDDSDVQLANTEILRILGSIQNITLNDDIFSNPVFRDLRDTRFTIPRPLQIGRSNPFLPIGFDDVTIQLIQEEEPVPEEQPVNDPFFPAGQEV